MKVRKFLFAGALIAASLFSVNSVMAQTTPTNSSTATVKIIFTPIQTITVNDASVLIEYKTKNDYNIGVSKTMNKHLTVFSTGAFNVQVKANSNFIRSEEKDFISASDVKIIPTALDDYKGVSEQKLEVGSYKTIITRDKGGRDISFDITYDNTEGPGDKYIDKYHKDDTKDNTFTATVEYLIVAA